MNDCPNCGFPLQPDFVRCPECGEPVSAPRLQLRASDGGTSVLTAPPEELGHLIIAAGPGAGKSFQLGPVTDIGRAATANQVVLNDTAVSRQHGRVRHEDGRFEYYDLGSQNGTRVITAQGARRRVKGAVPLQDGDQLEIGTARLVFREVARQERRAYRA